MRRLLNTMGLLVAVTALGGCGGGDSTGPGAGNGTVTASVDGTSFTANLATAAVHSSEGALTFAGVQSQGGTTRSINIALMNVTGPGTFSFGGGHLNVANYSEIQGADPQNLKAWTANMVAGSGTLTITELTSSRAMGTFSITLQPGLNTTGTKTLSNGSFDVKLISQ